MTTVGVWVVAMLLWMAVLIHTGTLNAAGVAFTTKTLPQTWTTPVVNDKHGYN
jgi:hypothetical protein